METDTYKNIIPQHIQDMINKSHIKVGIIGHTISREHVHMMAHLIASEGYKPIFICVENPPVDPIEELAKLAPKFNLPLEYIETKIDPKDPNGTMPFYRKIGKKGKKRY